MINLLLMFWEFFKTGLFAIGGGLATLPFLYNMADNYSWFTRSDLADMIAVSESTPGPIGINMATYAGFLNGGVIGGVLATVALVTPSIIVIIIVASFLQKFKDSFYVKSGFYGLHPAVAGLIAAAALEIFKVSLLNFDAFLTSHNPLDLFRWINVILFIALFVVEKKVKWHPAFIILIAAVIGIVLKL